MKDEIPFWVQFNGTNLPKNAVQGGHYKGQRIFIGRGEHRGTKIDTFFANTQKYFYNIFLIMLDSTF